ncbi:MAG TPA: metallophosphoesterase, partial [Blastococcus sp.]
MSGERSTNGAGQGGMNSEVAAERPGGSDRKRSWALLQRRRRGGMLRHRPRSAALVAYLLVLGTPGVILAIQVLPDSVAEAPASAVGDPVIAVGGDIACDIGTSPSANSCQQAATANVLTALAPDAVLPLGDTQYEDATAAAFAQMYDPTWGQVKSISHPIPGNHEYQVNASPYYDYFGAAAGDRTKGYYSWNIGQWHLVALNAECGNVPGGGCAAGSTQEQWLRADLAANPGKCTMAYWHEPRFSSGSGSNSLYQPFWQALYNAGADVILNGHAHTYERFAPQSPTGTADAAGPRQFVVGTGGVSFHGLTSALPNEQVRFNDTFGVMKMVLHPSGFDWQFLPVTGGRSTDSGTANCHNAAAPPGGTGLVNGDFENNSLTGWTSTGSTSVATTGHTGSRSATVGSTNPTGTSSIAQTFTAPTGTSNLSFW